MRRRSDENFLDDSSADRTLSCRHTHATNERDDMSLQHLLVERLERRCLLSGGFFDPTFGKNGIVIQGFAKGDYPQVAIQSDNRVVVSMIVYGTHPQAVLARFTEAGKLDES